MSPSVTFAVPTWKDVRIWLALVYGVFVFHALTFVGFGRTWPQLLASVAAGGFFDFVFNKWKYDRWIFPMSGMLSAVGPFLMIDSVRLGYFVLIAFLAVGSKFFFRWNGRHVFNPNTFGMLVAAIAFSGGMTPNPDRWGGSFEWTLIVFVSGAAIAWKADRWATAVSYYWSFFVGCLIRSAITGAPVLVYAGVMIGPMFQLICFFLITDPKTSPRDRRWQVAFGAAVALLDNLFRFYEMRLSIYIALSAATLLYAVVDNYTGDARASDPWREKELTLAYDA